MRLYTCSHYMLSSIQQTLQGGHAMGELFVKYQPSSVQKTILYHWATNEKTWVALSGGNSQQLFEIHELIQQCEEFVPYAPFYEDPSSLQGALTSVACVLPTHLCEIIDCLRTRQNLEKHIEVLNSLTEKQVELLERLASLPLAR